MAEREPQMNLTTGGISGNHVPNSLCNCSARAASCLTTKARPLLLLVVELLAMVLELVAGIVEPLIEGLLMGCFVGRPVAVHVVLLTEVATRAEKGIVGTKMVPPPKAVAKEVLHIQKIIILKRERKEKDEVRSVR